MTSNNDAVNHEALTYLYQEELYRITSPVVVVLPRAWGNDNSEEQLLLRKILTSVKVDMHAVRMITMPVVDIRSLAIYSPERVLIFGCECRDEIPFYQATTAQGFTVVRGDDLNALDDQKKKNLWSCLRMMFGI